MAAWKQLSFWEKLDVINDIDEDMKVTDAVKKTWIIEIYNCNFHQRQEAD